MLPHVSPIPLSYHPSANASYSYRVTNLQAQREVIGAGGGRRGAAAAVESGGAVVQELEGRPVLQRRRERYPVPSPHSGKCPHSESEA